MSIPSYRTCTPGETLQRVSPFFARLGITRLSRQTGLDSIGIPVWSAYAPNARAIVIAQGKGIDDMAARTSAAMEAIERSVATRPACPVTTTSLAEIEAAGGKADALTCLVASGHGPLSAHDVSDWVKARDLTSGAPIFLPFEAVHLDRTGETKRFWQSSDGLASGNTKSEAVLHGLLERVERDALTLWQVMPMPRRYGARIDPDSLRAEPELSTLLDLIAAADLELALFDITSDLQIACITAILAPKARSGPSPLRHVEVTLGCGCALSPLVAASRAITEAAQSRMTFIAGARDDLLPQMFAQTVSDETLQAFDAPFSVALHTLPSLEAAEATEALERLVAHLAQKRITRLYAVDLAPDWLPVSVVKVIAPQLENPDGDRRQRFGMRALSKALA
ncbi:YcaO-like family protein [Rhizobium sp. FY34]|uniref:YcaO-like family protein n=1 Tax=Rhizobium sp. FY34 TaxID=2562309 RepID=UPI001FED65FF|nr:YcaO-like family protein [Rhizobium sp. FY34]